MTVTYNVHPNLPAWSPSFGYTLGNRVVNSGNAYQCITAGTSAASGGPTGTTTNITDSNVHWKWLSAVDYTTLNLAAAGLPATFTQPVIWLLWNNGAFAITAAGFSLSGHTTSTVNTLTITPAVGEGIKDRLISGNVPLTFNAAAGVSWTMPTTGTPGVNYIDISDANVIFDGIQFNDPNSASGSTLFQSESTAVNLVLRSCIFDGFAQSGGATMVGINCANALVTNCLFVDRQTSTGGYATLTINNTGRIVNCTAIGINTPAGNTFAETHNATSTPNIIRNVASFGFPGGVAGAGTGSVSNPQVDHCATSSTVIGPSGLVTDNGSNIVSQSATSTFVSATTDFRLTLGSGCLNAGVTDTVDIPLSTDIAGRPRGSAGGVGLNPFSADFSTAFGGTQGTNPWAIGAIELTASLISGFSIATGRSRASQSAPAIGSSQTKARGVLIVTKPLAGQGRSYARGNTAATFIQPLQSLGRASNLGRSLIAGTLSITARATARSIGKVSPVLTALVAARGQTKTSGQSVPLVAQPLISIGKSRTDSSTVMTVMAPIVTRGGSIAKATGIFTRIALASAKGFSAARGTGVVATPGTMRGKSASAGRAVAIYLVTKTAFGFSKAFGGGSITPIVGLSGFGKSLARGNILYGSNVVILQASGLVESTGRTAALTMTAALAAQSATKAYGAGRTGLSQPIAAAGLSKAAAPAGAVYNAFLPSRGFILGKGWFDPTATLTAALSALGVARAAARAGLAYAARMSVISRGTVKGRAATSVAMPLIASGSMQASGQIGASTSQRLVGRGIAVARGRTTPTASLALSASARATSRATATITVSLPMVATGLGTMDGASVVAASAPLRGFGLSTGDAGAGGGFTVALQSAGLSLARGQLILTQRALLNSRGSASVAGQSQPMAAFARLVAVGRGLATARSANFGFAPIALVGSGQSCSIGIARWVPTTPLRSLGIGLSAGRCATTQLALMTAAGRSRSAGILAAAVAVGFQSRGLSKAIGKLYASNTIIALGQSSAAGMARLAAYYNVTPDAVGPKLSSIGQIPVFDAMDIGDVDFFSFDWSARVSAIGDPIIAATVTVSPAGMTVGPVVVVGDIVQVRMGAATVVETFSLRCTVTLRSGRILHWSAPVPVADF